MDKTTRDEKSNPTPSLEENEFNIELKGKKKKKNKNINMIESNINSKIIQDITSSSNNTNSIQNFNQNSIQNQNNDEPDYSYMEMLSMLYSKLKEHNPTHNSPKKMKLPPPHVVKVGSKKTSWINFLQIAQKINRANTDHIIKFFIAELACECNLDSKSSLIMKGIFQAHKIESILKKYIQEYVKCSVCKSGDTNLVKDSITRLMFLECNSCNSKRSVNIIQNGFHATTKLDRKLGKDKVEKKAESTETL